MIRRAILVVSGSLIGACAGPPATPTDLATSCDGPPPSYTADVRPILARRCFSCHTGDGPAADEHDFSREASAWAQRRSLAEEVAARAMPPSPRPPLTEAEAKALLLWARCGAEARKL